MKLIFAVSMHMVLAFLKLSSDPFCLCFEVTCLVEGDRLGYFWLGLRGLSGCAINETRKPAPKISSLLRKTAEMQNMLGDTLPI